MSLDLRPLIPLRTSIKQPPPPPTRAPNARDQQIETDRIETKQKRLETDGTNNRQVTSEEASTHPRGNGTTSSIEGMSSDERRIRELEEELRKLKMKQQGDDGSSSANKALFASGDGAPVVGIPEGENETTVWQLEQNVLSAWRVFIASSLIIIINRAN